MCGGGGDGGDSGDSGGGYGGPGGDYSPPAYTPPAEAPGLPGVSNYDPGALPSSSAPTSGGAPSGVADPFGVAATSSVAGSDFGYLNAPGATSSGPGAAAPGGGTGDVLPGANYGGIVPGYGTTDAGTGSGAPNLNTSPNTNVVQGAPTGQSAAPGLPGVSSGTDLTSAKPASAGSGSTDANQSVLKSLGITNPLGAAIGAAGLGYSAVNNKAPAFSPQLQAQAASLNAQGQQLMSYLQSGNLPPGLKAGLDQATAAAKAKIISNYASQGLNTDPNQNTVLAQQLAAVDQQALISTAQIGQQLLSTGVTETGLSSDLYKTLAQIDQTQTANIGKAIANFASALSGGGTKIQIGSS